MAIVVNYHWHMINQRVCTMDINNRYTYENQQNTANLLNRQGKLRYSEPIVNYIWNSRRYYILGQSWKNESARQISNTNYKTVARNSYDGNWQNVYTYSAEQSTHWNEVGYNNLNEAGSWNARRDVTKILNADWSKKTCGARASVLIWVSTDSPIIYGRCCCFFMRDHSIGREN